MPRLVPYALPLMLLEVGAACAQTSWVRTDLQVNPRKVGAHPDPGNLEVTQSGLSVGGIDFTFDSPNNWNWTFELKFSAPPERIISGQSFPMTLSGSAGGSRKNGMIGVSTGYRFEGLTSDAEPELFVGHDAPSASKTVNVTPNASPNSELKISIISNGVVVWIASYEPAPSDSGGSKVGLLTGGLVSAIPPPPSPGACQREYLLSPAPQDPRFNQIESSTLISTLLSRDLTPDEADDLDIEDKEEYGKWDYQPTGEPPSQQTNCAGYVLAHLFPESSLEGNFDTDTFYYFVLTRYAHPVSGRPAVGDVVVYLKGDGKVGHVAYVVQSNLTQGVRMVTKDGSERPYNAIVPGPGTVYDVLPTFDPLLRHHADASQEGVRGKVEYWHFDLLPQFHLMKDGCLKR